MATVIKDFSPPGNGRRRGSGPGGCGRFGLALFFLAFLLAGVVAGYFMGQEYLEDYRASSWPKIPATILEARTIATRSDNGTTYRPEFTFEYEYKGRTYVTKGYRATKVSTSGNWARREIEKFPRGSTAMAFVNPDDPTVAYLRAGLSPGYIALTIPVLFAGVGLMGLFYAIVGLRTPKPEAGQLQPQTLGIPGPCVAGAGKYLRSRLKLETSHWAMFFGLLFVAFIWNGISVTGFVLAWDDREWVAVGFLSLFVAVGIGLVGFALHRLLRILLLGGTHMEISAEPAAPGQQIRFAFEQEGHFLAERAVVRLVCLEWVQYRVGTKTKTEEHKVLEQPLAIVQGFQASAGNPLLLRGEFTLPEDAMHSFEASSNRVRWQLEAEVTIPGRPDVKDHFPFRVLPANAHSIAAGGTGE